MNSRDKRIAKRAEPAIVGPDVPIADPMSDVPDIVAVVGDAGHVAPDTAIVVDPINDAIAVFSVTFPGVPVPGYFRPFAAGIIAGINAPINVPDDALKTVVAGAMATALPNVPLPTRTYGRYAATTIARAQNGLYVVAACVTIGGFVITDRIGSALWSAECPTAACRYVDHPTYFRSTMGDYINGRHNDTPSIPHDAARSFVNAWRGRKPGTAR